MLEKWLLGFLIFATVNSSKGQKIIREDTEGDPMSQPAETTTNGGKCSCQCESPKIVRVEVPKLRIKYIPVVVKSRGNYQQKYHELNHRPQDQLEFQNFQEPTNQFDNPSPQNEQPASLADPRVNDVNQVPQNFAEGSKESDGDRPMYSSGSDQNSFRLGPFGLDYFA